MVGQLIKKLPAVYKTRRFIIVFTRARHWTVSQLNQVYPFT